MPTSKIVAQYLKLTRNISSATVLLPRALCHRTGFVTQGSTQKIHRCSRNALIETLGGPRYLVDFDIEDSTSKIHEYLGDPVAYCTAPDCSMLSNRSQLPNCHMEISTNMAEIHEPLVLLPKMPHAHVDIDSEILEVAYWKSSNIIGKSSPIVFSCRISTVNCYIFERAT